MNSQQIEYFLEVVRQGSFTKAAQILYTSQPSLSRQIAKLEEELGVSLFNRSRTGTELSYMGRKYYDAFVEMQQKLNALAMEARGYAIEDEKKVCIGIPEGWDLRPVVEKVNEKLEEKDIRLSMEFASYSYRSLLTLLRNHQVDGCICPKGLIAPMDNMAYTDLPPVNNVILYSKRHLPPENGVYYTIQDFRQDRLLLLQQEDISKPKSYQLGFLHEKGIVPETREYHNIDSILLDVSLNKGFAISDIWSRGVSDRSLGCLVLDQKMPICIAWNKHFDSAELSLFIDVLCETLQPNN